MAVVAVLALIGFGVFRVVKDLPASPGIASSPTQPAPGTSSLTTPLSSDTTTTEASTTTTEVATTTTTARSATSIEYRNTQYGFSFSLPLGWKGYWIVGQQWQGFTSDPSGTDTSTTSVSVYGPEILIRHPAWMSSHPRQDIPIMVFTLAQWDLVQQARLDVSAAPIPPSELGRNATYVFALPPRYNYAFPTGYQEVENILAGRPLHAL